MVVTQLFPSGKLVMLQRTWKAWACRVDYKLGEEWWMRKGCIDLCQGIELLFWPAGKCVFREIWTLFHWLMRNSSRCRGASRFAT